MDMTGAFMLATNRPMNWRLKTPSGFLSANAKTWAAMATRRSGGILLVDRLIDPLSQLHPILNFHELAV